MSYIKDQLQHTLKSFNINLGDKNYSGKVRENFYLEDEIVMVTTDRVSAFDHILGTIPFKGEILTQIAKFWFEKTKDIAPNHYIDDPDPQVLLTKRAEPLPIEIIIRGYITGSLWRDYSSGIDGQYGFKMPEGMKKNQKFDSPIITPTTKADYGEHDEAISKEEIISGLVDKDIYEKAEKYAMALFSEGQKWADERGLILVDTKYEFGMIGGELHVIDEIHTPDSSRYWISNEYESRFSNGENQLMLDKENIRQWLIEKGFSGEGTPPELSEDIRLLLSEKYMELYKVLIGNDYNPSLGDVNTRIINNLTKQGLLKENVNEG
jgi:phosphoribosylaminoimidazole-succinocarboxamide synthase